MSFGTKKSVLTLGVEMETAARDEAVGRSASECLLEATDVVFLSSRVDVAFGILQRALSSGVAAAGN